MYKELRYTLTDTTGIPVVLTVSPDGWDDTMIVFERSKKYYGVFRSFSIPIKFVKEGATIIRNEFYTHRVRAYCGILIEKLNKITLEYEVAFIGKVDFITFKDGDNYVECNMIDGGLAEVFKAKENDEVSFKANSWGESMAIQAYIFYPPASPDDHYTWAMNFFQMFGAIVDKMTDGGLLAGTFGIKSDLLNTPVVYGGIFEERYYLTTESSLKYVDQGIHTFDYITSLADFFTAVNAIAEAGMGIEVIDGVETIVLEQRSYFFPDETITELGEAKNLSLTLNQELNFSKIKCGYANKSYSDTANQGNDEISINEPNTETTYSVPNVTSSKEYDIMSKYRADSAGITQLWNSEEVDTKDTGMVILDLKWVQQTLPSGPFNWRYRGGLLRKKFQTDPCAYPFNVSISPKRSLLSHKAFIDSCCFGLSGYDINFLNGTNDQILNETATQQPVPVVYLKEYEGFEIGGAEYFLPLLISIDVPYSQNMPTLMNIHPTGKLAFSYEGTRYSGFIMKAEIKLAGRGSVKFSLLSSVDNNFSNLIR